MNKEELIEFFKLNKNEELFELALKPPSCGGSDEFRLLALEGDIILTQTFIKILEKRGIINTGDIAKLRGSFHKKETLNKLSRSLEIDLLMIPLDSNHIIQEKETAEVVEALISASSKHNDDQTITDIVRELLDKSEDLGLLEPNYKGVLLEKSAQEAEFLHIECFETESVSNIQNQPPFKSTIKGKYKEIEFQRTSSMKQTKIKAEQDAAKQVLLYDIYQSEEIPGFQVDEPTMEVLRSASQSIEDREILFSKNEDTMFENKMNITKGTGELLIEWVLRKSKKDPFSMLLLLNTRLEEEISGSAWYATIEKGELVLFNLEINTEHFFAVGFGTSKTQARKDAANKILLSSNLFEWLKKNKKNE